MCVSGCNIKAYFFLRVMGKSFQIAIAQDHNTRHQLTGVPGASTVLSGTLASKQDTGHVKCGPSIQQSII